MQGKLNFLVIDDCEPVLAIYTQLLQQAGHNIMALPSCDEATQAIDAFQPDCILCDMILPGMDWHEFFRHVRQTMAEKEPVFIVISAKQFDYDRREALKVGVDAYLTKPINHSTFVAELMHVINSKAHQKNKQP